MGRHWHRVNVRADGLAPVLGGLLRDTRVRCAALVDVDSGMVLDACTSELSGAEVEVQAAAHADLVRVTLGALGGPEALHGRCEMLVDDGAGRHHVLRVVPDGHDGLLVLSALVAGPERVAARVRRRLRRVSSAALTAGPSTVRRPLAARWVPGLGPSPAPRSAPAPALPGARARDPDAAPAPPSALPPGPARRPVS